MGGLKAIGTVAAGSPACTRWCPGENLPESGQIPAPRSSPHFPREQDPVLNPGQTLIYPQVISLGRGVSNQSGLALLAKNVRLLQFSPPTFFLFYFKGVVYFVSFMFIKKLIV